MAAFFGLSFRLAIIIPPDCVVLSYISLEVYTNFGIVPLLTLQVLLMLAFQRFQFRLQLLDFGIPFGEG